MTDERLLEIARDIADVSPPETKATIRSLVAEVERLQARVPCWVPVQDWLPTETRWVLVPDGRRELWLLAGVWYEWNGCLTPTHPPTHWMGRPLPPKKEGEP